MDRLTINTPQGPALKMGATYPTEEAAREDLMRLFYVAVGRLAAYEDTMPLERAQELAQAEKEGRLSILPSDIGDILCDIGKTVLMTRKEAEAALKKREEDNEAD